MNGDLFFIGLMLRALDAPDPRRAMEEALRRALSLGGDASRSRGHAQFRAFMKRTRDMLQKNVREIVESDAEFDQLRAAFGVDPRGTRQAVSQMWLRPDLRIRFAEFARQARVAGGEAPGMEVVLCGGNREMARVSRGGTILVPRVFPGLHNICFSTGRLLWEGRLRDCDLLLACDASSAPLRLAADTPGALFPSAREIRCLGGEVLMRVYPGIEHGRAEVAFQTGRVGT